MLLDGQIDAVTFTSPTAVRRFVAIIGEEQAVDLLGTTVVAAIGPVTAAAALRARHHAAIVADTYTVDGLVQAIVEHFAQILAHRRSNDGSAMSRIVRSPGAACSTFGIELTVIDAVAMSPCTPPAIIIESGGLPVMRTASNDSGAPRYASMWSVMIGSPFR